MWHEKTYQSHKVLLSFNYYVSMKIRTNTLMAIVSNFWKKNNGNKSSELIKTRKCEISCFDFVLLSTK